MAGRKKSTDANVEAGASGAAAKPARGRAGRKAGEKSTPRVKPASIAAMHESKEIRQREHRARVEEIGHHEVYELEDPALRIHVGDCREVLSKLPEFRRSEVDLVFADPPFNWNRAYDKWDDSMPREDYLKFTREWLDVCVDALRPTGAIWVNIPDDTCAEIVMHLKSRNLAMVNWCIWHYRFGQNTTDRFINSKVHALYFCKGGLRTWNPREVLEMSDRAAIYADPRTQNKADGMPPGMRVPMDVWYGQYWGRIQGNNAERRANHDNQLPEVYLERVIRACSNAGDLVVDPFTGSGTTPVVARALKRRFIGSEFSVDNARSAFARVKAGPIRIGAAIGASTAIFENRAKRRSTWQAGRKG
ncbi:MAG: site-specific DNA-methyltransferase [Phycisphaerales bacterium]